MEDKKKIRYHVERAILDYNGELKTAKEWQQDGMKEVKAMVAGEDLAKGRKSVPIDEYVKHWSNGLEKLRAMKARGEEDASEFNY